MTDATAPRSRVQRARRALKSLAYSGLRRGRWQHPDRVLAALGLAAGQRAADIGAGGGYFTFRLARAVGPDGRVYAVDTDADMLSLIADKAARQGLATVVAVAGGERDPALPEPVDLALVVNAFHHLPDPGGYAAALARSLRPGGRLAVIEARPRWFLFGHATAPERIREVVTAAGYDVADEHDYLPNQSFLVFTPRQSSEVT